jgi:hypothetical protein
MLDVSQLGQDIKAAFTSGVDEASSDSIAVKLADAIVSYASGAEILMLPGPIMIPLPKPPVVSAGLGASLTLSTADVGRSALESGIKSQFAAEDPALSTMATAIQAYVATFTAFQATAGHSAVGATLMPVAPVLAGVVAAGVVGADLITSATSMANIIHASFLSSTFTGLGAAVDTGVGPVVQTLT